MSETQAVTDWAASRGQTWRKQLSGLEAMLAPVNDPLIEALHLDAPYRIADIGCGGAAATLEILRLAPPGTVIHGFDIAPPLVEAARARIGCENPGIAIELADMATATPAGPLYDRLVSRFGIMFFEDPPAAFANLQRWLSPSGRFAFAVWGPPADNPWMTTARQVVAQFISLPASDPSGPGPFRYAATESLFPLLGQAGFANLALTQWRGDLNIGGGLSPTQAAKFALASFSNFGELLAEAGGDALSEATKALTAFYETCQVGGVARLPACVHICTGTRRNSLR